MNRATLHTSTFGGNTRSAAAGIAVINELVKSNLSEDAQKKGDYLLKALGKLKDKYPMIKEIRGRGLMIGLAFEDHQNQLLNRLSNNMLDKMKKEYFGSLIAGELFIKYQIITAYTLNNPNVIRIEPPLTVTYEQLDRLIDAIDGVCQMNKSFLGAVRQSMK